MKFVPRLPAEGINDSRTHPLKDLAVLLGGVLALGLGAFFLLSFLLGKALLLIPPEDEARLFSGLRDQLQQMFALVADVDRQEELQELLSELVEGWPGAPYPFELVVIEEEEPNALAFPGGLIVVTSGLLDGVSTENGLAFVLSHELGHFAHRDHLRHLSRGLALGAVLTLFTGSGSSVGSKVVRLSGEISNRRFSQKQETAADLFALELLHRCHGHVGGATEFFEGLIESGEDSASFLSSHPAPQARIDLLRSTIAAHGWAATLSDSE